MPLSFPELQRIYDEHAQALYGFASSVVRREDEAREALQDVFVKLAGDPACIARAENERAFLLTMIYRIIVDRSRRNGARGRALERYESQPVSIGKSPSAMDRLVAGEHRRAVENALALLPEDQRAVVVLKLWEEMTFEQIAGALGIAANTAASRYRYALDKLRTLLRLYLQEIL